MPENLTLDEYLISDTVEKTITLGDKVLTVKEQSQLTLEDLMTLEAISNELESKAISAIDSYKKMIKVYVPEMPDDVLKKITTTGINKMAAHLFGEENVKKALAQSQPTKDVPDEEKPKP